MADLGADADPPRLPGRDLLLSVPERFRPPAFSRVETPLQRAALKLRHLMDPAAAGIWRDLSRVFPEVRGGLLDVGCGAQPYRHLVPPGVRYQGIDRVETRAAFGYSVPDTLYYEGDRWPVEDASVDWILCSEVLEHVERPAAFLDEAFRCLKPGGRLLLTVPFSARWHYIPHDYWRYTPSGLRVLLDGAGFKDGRVTARGNPLTVACHKAMSLVFPLLLGAQLGWRRLPALALGLVLLPFAALAGLVAYATLSLDFGLDCMGYTVLASRPLGESA
jgi:SAM-dependent methyltransferase